MSSCFSLKTLSDSDPIACRGTRLSQSILKRHRALCYDLTVSSWHRLWRHTSPVSLACASSSLPSAILSHVLWGPAFTSLNTSESQRQAPSFNVQVCLFSGTVLETEPQPKSEVWLGSAGICHLFDHLATYFEPLLLGTCLSSRKRPEPALQASLAAKV